MDNQAAPQARPAGFFEPGEIVGGSYEVLDFLGRGAMGMVYKVKHVSMSAEYALKILTGNQISEMNVLRFQNEAQAIAKLNHPNIIAVYNFGLHDGRLPFYVMDLLSGENLLEKVDAFGPPPIDVVLSMYIEVCAGLSYAHKKGILHRDVKPANFVVLDAPDVRGARIKVVDFGIVKFAEELKPDAQKLTAVGDVCGSPSYMSPEQASAQKIDARSDVYSLGCSLFQTLTGRLPFLGRSATDTMMMHFQKDAPTLASKGDGRVYSEELEALVARMLAKAPMDRYQSMDQVALDLRNILDGKPLGTPAAPARSAEISPSRPGTTGDARRTVKDLSASGKQPVFSDPAQTAASESDDTGSFAGAASGISTRAKALVLGGAVLTISVAAGAFFLFRPQAKPAVAPLAAVAVKQSPTSLSPVSVPAQKASSNDLLLESNVPPDLEHVKLPSLTTAKYFSRIVNEGGKQYVEFDFPKPSQNEFLAYVATTRESYSSTEGKVRFLKGAPITIAPKPTSVKMPQFFEKFRPGEISGLFLSDMAPSDELFKMVVPRLPGITRLFMNRSPQLTDKIMPDLSRLNLTLFFASGTSIDGAQLARASFWPRLKQLNLSNCSNLSPVLQKLSGSNNLLYLNLADNKLSPRDYEYISELPSLKFLDLSHTKMEAVDLQKLAALKQLTRLDAIYMHVKDGSLADCLKRLPSLKSLTIARGTMKSSDLAALQHTNPQLKILQLTSEQLPGFVQLQRYQELNTGIAPAYLVKDNVPEPGSAQAPVVDWLRNERQL